jgi:monofunctional glycosyltransferase
MDRRRLADRPCERRVYKTILRSDLFASARDMIKPTHGAMLTAKHRRRLKKIALWTAGIALFGPIVLILPLNIIDPPTTMLMLSRTFSRLGKDKSPAYPRREVVSLERISKEIVRAVIASEDDAFYLHDGFDFRQIERAVAERKQKRRVRGASTITQQTAKNLFLWTGRSFIRKGFEAYLTFYLELLLSKDRILEIYLNLIECGDGYFGVEECSRHHFKKSAIEVGPEEAARLAAILPSPRKRSPFGDYANERVSAIMEVMTLPIAKPKD